MGQTDRQEEGNGSAGREAITRQLGNAALTAVPWKKAIGSFLPHCCRCLERKGRSNRRKKSKADCSGFAPLQTALGLKQRSLMPVLAMRQLGELRIINRGDVQ